MRKKPAIDFKTITTLVLLAVGTFIACFFMFRLLRDGFVPLALFVGACVIFVVLSFLRKSLTAYRWLSVGIVMAVLFTIYPIFYTVYLSFTNMSGGHLLTKAQAVERLRSEQYTDDSAASYSWSAYHSKDDAYMLLLNDGAGNFIEAGENTPFVTHPELTAVPDRIGKFTLLKKGQVMQSLETLGKKKFGKAPDNVVIKSIREVAVSRAAYSYDDKADSFTDNRTHKVYTPVKGTYTSSDGSTLIPGFMCGIGAQNYTRFLGNPGYRQPILQILIWNICFSLFSVLISFAVGLMIALLFEDLPAKRLIRSLLIIPYPVPVLVSIMVWRALLNERMGLVTNLFTTMFGFAPRFFTDINAARIALIIINVYLSYPYFYILASGALKSIPGELFEAAAIDGAGSFTVLRRITLPMVMRILAPLVIASFSFNFNNFTLIWGYNAGLPAMADTIVPMGYTDLLISFIYRLGFATANAADYGFSAAITVMLFVLVATMVFFQSINTKTIKGDN